MSTTLTPRVVAALKAGLPGTRVATKIPSPRPRRLVRVEHAGGQGEHDQVLDDAAFVISCWEADDILAEQLAQDARSVLRAWADADLDVWDYRGTGPASFPDPATAADRFVFRCSFTTRGR